MARFRELFLAVLASVLLTNVGLATEIPIQFTLDEETVTSAGVYTPEGRLVRVLWSLKRLPVGSQSAQWDGLDDLGRNVPPAEYEVRVAHGNARYFCLGTIGNSGLGQTMQSGTDDLICDRKTGEIYTANNWEEAGQDFRKMDADGQYLMDAKFGIRNGNPNGWPNALAVDGGVLYCAVFASRDSLPGQPPGKRLAGGYVLRKFDAADGKPLKYPTDTGYIRVRLPDPADEDPMSRQSIRSIVVCGQAVVLADKWTGKISRFDKASGAALGEFTLKQPACMAVDDQQRLWIAYDGCKVGVFDLAGRSLEDVPVPAIEIVTIRLAGDRLWVADAEAGIAVYKLALPGKAETLRTYGHKARPGEFSPLAIGRIRSFDVMPDGGFVMSQTYGAGSVVTRFTADAKVVWQQVGLEFCTNLTYDALEPDLLITSLSNAYRVLDRTEGTWRFEGTLFDASPFDKKARLAAQSTGTPRIVTLGGRRFYFNLTGDQIKVFRLDHGMKLATWAGNGQRAWHVPTLGPMPASEPGKGLQFCWTDTNGDCKVQPGELTVTRENGVGGFSAEVLPTGDVVLPNHGDRGVWLLPLARFDAAGNPFYDWNRLQRILPPDDTLRDLRPMKVVPIPDGYLVLQHGEASFYPTAKCSGGWNYCWMGGKTLSRYARDGTRLWSVDLPDWCTGVDAALNADRTALVGIVVGQFTAKNLYHYSPDGLLLGTLQPGFETGWLDHNGSLSICRDPQDGLADVFAEESYRNRISWYRLDDRSVTSLKIRVRKMRVEGETYTTEKEFYEQLDDGQQRAKAGKRAEAAAALAKALDLARPAERPFVEQMLGNLLLAVPDRVAEGIGYLQHAADAPTFDGHKRAEAIFRINAAYRRLKEFPKALAVLDQVARLPVAKERGYVPRAMLEMARTQIDAGDLAAARKQAEKVQAYFKSRPNDDAINLCWDAFMATAETYQREHRPDAAIAAMEQSRAVPRLDDDRRAATDMRIAGIHVQEKDYARAITCYRRAANGYPSASLHTRADAMLREGAAHAAAGDVTAARKSYQAVIDLPQVPANYVQTAKDRLAVLAKAERQKQP